MEYAPSDGYPPVSAGLLDGGTVWRAICRHVFDMGEREAELVEHLLTNISESRISDIRDKLMIDLSPINYGDGKHHPHTQTVTLDDHA